MKKIRTGIKLKSPHSAGQSYTLIFPSTAPTTDKIIKTNASGNLSFAEAPSGGLQFIKSTSSSSEVSNLNCQMTLLHATAYIY